MHQIKIEERVEHRPLHTDFFYCQPHKHLHSVFSSALSSEERLNLVMLWALAELLKLLISDALPLT